MKHKIFIDGGHGTTGLKIREYLDKREDIEILEIDPEKRKDLDERVKMTTLADVTIMCLPDAAAAELAEAAPADVTIIDTSSKHRTAEGWVYGMPELEAGQRDKIKASHRISNPGCHASGFILLARPLVDAGVIGADYPMDCFCITGYSGGGKKMIANHEDPERGEYLASPGQYALGQSHKHLPEMMKMTGITEAPSFCPVVGDFYSGMVMTIQLHKSLMNKKMTVDEIRQVYMDRYGEEALIDVMEETPGDGFIHSNIKSGMNNVEIFVSGNDDRPLLIARYDNLGKGASGAAVQNLNIVLGTEETKGLL